MVSFIKAFATVAICGSLLVTSTNAEGHTADKLSMYPNGLPCTPCPIDMSTAVTRAVDMEECTVYVKVNLFASETGTSIKKIVEIRLLQCDVQVVP